MLRINTLGLYMALVLTLGLMSCAKKQEAKRDDYRAPAPRIIKNGQNVGLNDWDRASQRALDIHDAVDIRNSGSSRAEISSHCRRAGGDSQHSITVTEQNPIPVFQILSEELLVEDLAQESATCALQIILENKNGSRHIFNIANVTVHDSQDGKAVLEQQGQLLAPASRARFFQNSLLGVAVRPPIVGTAARLICKDAHSAEISVGNSVGLADFDLARMNIRQGRSADILQSNVQLCRVTFSLVNLPQAVTPQFEMQWAREPLILRPDSQLNRNDIGKAWDFPNDPLLLALNGRPVQIATYAIQNRSAFARTVRLSKQPLPVQIYINLIQHGDKIATVTRPYLLIQPQEGVVADSNEFIKISVPAKSVVKLNVVFQPPREIRCLRQTGGSFNLPQPNLTLDFPAPLKIEELNENSDSVANVYSTDLGPRVYVNMYAAFFNLKAPEQVGNLCGW